MEEGRLSVLLIDGSSSSSFAVPPLPRVGEIRAGYHEATMSHSVKFDTHYAGQILPTVTLPSVGLGRTSVLMLVQIGAWSLDVPIVPFSAFLGRSARLDA